MSKIPDKLPVKEASDLAKLPDIERSKAERVPEGERLRLIASVSWWERSWLFVRQNVMPLVQLAGRIVGLDLSAFFTPTQGPLVMDLKKTLIGAAGIALGALGLYLQSTTPEGITLGGALSAVGAALIAWLFPQPKGKS